MSWTLTFRLPCRHWKLVWLVLFRPSTHVHVEWMENITFWIAVIVHPLYFKFLFFNLRIENPIIYQIICVAYPGELWKMFRYEMNETVINIWRDVSRLKIESICYDYKAKHPKYSINKMSAKIGSAKVHSKPVFSFQVLQYHVVKKHLWWFASVTLYNNSVFVAYTFYVEMSREREGDRMRKSETSVECWFNSFAEHLKMYLAGKKKNLEYEASELINSNSNDINIGWHAFFHIKIHTKPTANSHTLRMFLFAHRFRNIFSLLFRIPPLA